MNFGPEALDLVVLAADKHIAVSVDTLIRRRRVDLGIRAVSFDMRRHPNSDPGCRTNAVEFLRPFVRGYRRAIVVFDHRGCGSQEAPKRIQRDIESALGRNGWKGRSKAIVIVPELEAWVWIPSGKVARTLGWNRSFESLRTCLEERGFWPARQPKPTDPKKALARCRAIAIEPGQPKPDDPKKALEQVLRRNRKVSSSALFKEMAASVDFDDCRDPAFNELRQTLRGWFPADAIP